MVIHNDVNITENAQIKTIFGYKKIKDINVNDIVLTHLGNYKKVTNISTKDFEANLDKIPFEVVERYVRKKKLKKINNKRK
jgi:hypothetical protein